MNAMFIKALAPMITNPFLDNVKGRRHQMMMGMNATIMIKKRQNVTTSTLWCAVAILSAGQPAPQRTMARIISSTRRNIFLHQ